MLARQLTLLSAPPSFDPQLTRLTHLPLGHGAWLDHLPGWLRGHEQLFETLYRDLAWRQETRPMYESMVEVPRLLARVGLDGPIPPIVQQMADTLSAHYGRSLHRIGAALYRNGHDSVAWHGDRIPNRDDSLIALVSLGEPRRFLLRPSDGGRSRSFDLGWGDLLVMGGTCQERYEHCVPKVAAALPRMSLQFRETHPR